jgi:hypothetical protein
MDGDSWFALAVGVASNDPDALSSVVCSDSTSRNNKRPRGVADGFQVSQHIVECQRDETSNVFTNDPSGSRECNNSAHLRPEVTVVFLGFLVTGDAEGLAGEASADEINRSEPTQSVCIDSMDILEAGDARPVFGEDGSAELISLTEGNGSHPSAFESKAESSNPREQV